MKVFQSALAKKDREARFQFRTKRTLEEVKRILGDRTRTDSSGYFTNIVLENPHQGLTF